MKLLLVFALCAFAAALPPLSFEEQHVIDKFPFDKHELSPENRSILVNILIRQLIAYIRYVIKYGSAIFNIPPLDPLKIEEYHLYLPAGLLNIDMVLKDAIMTGIGSFVVHKSYLQLSDLSFDFDISVPRIHIDAEHYDLVGDFFTAFPLYGKGRAEFEIINFRLKAKLFLKQSDDERSVIIDRIENPSFVIPHIKSNLSGVIGGGDFDAIANAVVEEVIIDYVNRFQGAISHITSLLVIEFGNPLLNQLNSWRYLEVLL